MLTIGSRGSQLALWQARWIQDQLLQLGQECRIEIIRTTGDKVTDVPLARVGGKGLFTKEIEEALLERVIDVAVHSMKDVPTSVPEGLTIAAVPPREDPRDAVVGMAVRSLPRGARVGTSSLRRSAQLLALRPDLHVESVRGNVDTRLRKLDEGEFQAIILAAAGLRRLGLDARIVELLEPDLMCPAAGQGALAVETRDDGGHARKLCGRLDHPKTRAAVTAERALLAALGGGCQVPIGAHAWHSAGVLKMQALVISPDGRTVIRRDSVGAPAEAENLGAMLGRELLEAGAQAILDAVYGDGADAALRT